MLLIHIETKSDLYWEYMLNKYGLDMLLYNILPEIWPSFIFVL